MSTYTGTAGNDSYFAMPDDDQFNLLGGNDQLTIWSNSSTGHVFTIDLGDGDDFLRIAGAGYPVRFTGVYYYEGTGNFTITTGPGRDTIQPFAYRVTVTDFDPALDRIDLSLRDQLFSAREAYQIYADGADTIIAHLGGSEQIRLINVTPSSLNATSIVNADPIVATISGTAGPDILTGGNASEKLIGGGGNDSLTGGGGSDLFYVQGRDAGIAQIHDFKSGQDWIGLDSTGFGLSPGDPVIYYSGYTPISPATLFYVGSPDAQQFPYPAIVYDPTTYTVTYVQGATAGAANGGNPDASVLAQIDPASTVSYASSINAGARPTNWVIAGNYSGQIIWRDADSSHVELWGVGSDGSHATTDLGATKGRDWTLAGVADLNGDGSPDIIWRNIATSQVDAWQMKNGNWEKSIDLGATKGGSWQLAGAGDFNGDGTDDVLWRNSDTGQVDQWQMKNGNWARSIDLGATKPAAWVAAGVGDFNGDGTGDVLWRNLSTGQVDEWHMRDGNWARSIDLGATKPSNWEVVGVANLNANKTSDILWRDLKTGQTDAWIMKDGNWAGSSAIGPHDTSFQSAGVSSSIFGTAVVWHNATTGQTDLWQLVSTEPLHAYDYLVV